MTRGMHLHTLLHRVRFLQHLHLSVASEADLESLSALITRFHANLISRSLGLAAVRVTVQTACARYPSCASLHSEISHSVCAQCAEHSAARIHGSGWVESLTGS
eukprot:647347-Rhodomonas_salina.2